jgi:uncharacterized tellurite resistance protein B-like protein
MKSVNWFVMPIVIRVLLVLALLAVVVTPAVLIWRYRRWPPYVWKQLLARRIVKLSDRRHALEREGAQGIDLAVRRLADEMIRCYLQGIPVEQLAEYPGIGPATVDRLREAGCRGVSDVTAARIANIEGIGRTRTRDLTAAVRSLTQAARSRFDAGACPEAREYRERMEKLRADEQGRALARTRELTALDAALQEAEKLNDVARHISLWSYLTNRDVPGLTEVLSRPLPELRELPPIPVGRLEVVKSPVADAFQAELQKPVIAPEPGRAEHPWLPKMRAVVGFAFTVARSDGRVAEAERKAIREFLAARFGHDPVLVRHIDPLMQQTEAAIPDETAVLTAVYELTTPTEREELHKFAERIIDASSGRNSRERAALVRVATAFGIPAVAPAVAVASAAPAVAAQAVAAPAVMDSKAILEISPEVSVTVDLIRRRYVLLREKLDPAKAASMGPEFRRMADEKRAKLRAAAEDLLRPFGAPLDPPAAPPPPTDIRHNPDLDDVFGV